MAITDTSLVISRACRKPGLVSRITTQIGHVLAALAEAVATRLRAIEARAKLHGLSDHQLDDIGLSRADVEHRFPDPLLRDPSDSLHRYKDMVGK